MGDSEEIVHFAITTDDLRLAIRRLATVDGSQAHPEVWQALTAERARREGGKAALWVPLARKHHDALPESVRTLLHER